MSSIKKIVSFGWIKVWVTVHSVLLILSCIAVFSGAHVYLKTLLILTAANFIWFAYTYTVLIKRLFFSHRSKVSVSSLDPVFYRAVMHSANDAIVISCRDIIIDGNRKAEEMFLCSREEGIGKSIYEFFSESLPKGESLTGLLEMLREKIYSGERLQIEWLCKKMDGTDFEVEVSIDFFVDGADPYVVFIVRDISERKKRERRLQASEARFKMIADYGFDIEVFRDKDLKVQYVSPSIQRILGYSPEEYISGDLTLKDLVEEHEFDKANDHFVNAMKGKPCSDVHVRLKAKNGDSVFVLCSSQPVIADDGVFVGIRSTIRDITKQEMAEIQLKASKENAEMASRAKSQFLANVSHDIRTPLSSVLGYAELLDYTSLNKEQREYLSAIRNSGHLLMALINDVLDISKIEAGEIRFEKTTFNLQRLIEETFNIFREDIRNRPVQLYQVYNNDVPREFLGDPSRVQQVLMNLISNALKFTDKGEVVVSVDAGLVREKSMQVYISVKDTGIGIPEDKRVTIFDSFSQVDEGNTRRYGGSGLGLAISKALVEKMGGRLSLESELGKGSLFKAVIRLGVADVEKDGIVDHDEGQGVLMTFSNLKVLVVDDNPINAKMLEVMLEKFGCVVESALSGEEALMKASNLDFDLAFMDVQMPLLDGIATTKKLRNDMGKTFPIIALSASAVKEDEVSALNAGMNDYLTKPVSIDCLSVSLKKWSDCLVGESEND